jgi:hypothetical protein
MHPHPTSTPNYIQTQHCTILTMLEEAENTPIIASDGSAVSIDVSELIGRTFSCNHTNDRDPHGQ